MMPAGKPSELLQRGHFVRGVVIWEQFNLFKARKVLIDEPASHVAGILIKRIFSFVPSRWHLLPKQRARTADQEHTAASPDMIDGSAV